MGPRPLMYVYGHWLQAERALTRGNHVQRYRMAIPAAVHVLRLQPRAQARIEDFGLALPEIRPQSALDPEVI